MKTVSSNEGEPQMRASKLFTATVFISAVTLLSAGFAVAAPPQDPGSNGNRPVAAANGQGESSENSSHRIAKKHDHQINYTGWLTSGYTWDGFATVDTQWTVKVHAKEAQTEEFSKGTVHFHGENPDGSFVDMVGQVEFVKQGYGYVTWAGRDDVVVMAGATTYDGASYDFIYLESEQTVWIALSDGETWEDHVYDETVFVDRDFQTHSPNNSGFELPEKVIHG